MKRMSKILMPLILILALTVTGCTMGESNSDGTMHASAAESVVSLDEVPEYGGDPYVVVNDNEPSFSKIDLQSASFEEYSDLDNLGRCGTAFANIGRDLMPTEKRGSIGSVKPSGWKTVKYDNVDGKYLYNRCHLIGYQLTAENANEKNLITGTRYMNVEGMLPFENLVADYIKETNNHVLYRVTPIYDGKNLVASGVQMEAESVEDEGEGVKFNVYVYNNQPGIVIDYATGDSRRAGDTSKKSDSSKEQTFVVNTNTHRFHNPSCSSAKDTKASNKETLRCPRQELIDHGYEPCQRCRP